MYSSYNASEFDQMMESLFVNVIGPCIDIAFWGVVAYGLGYLAVFSCKKVWNKLTS